MILDSYKIEMDLVDTVPLPIIFISLTTVLDTIHIWHVTKLFVKFVVLYDLL